MDLYLYLDLYLYHDQLTRMKFRLFHLILEICKYHHHTVNMSRIGTYWLRIMYVDLSEHTRTIPHWFHALFLSKCSFGIALCGRYSFWIVSDKCSVSVANNFVHCQTASGYGYPRLVNWLGSSTLCYRRSSKGLLCLLLSNGMTMCCQFTPNLLQLLMGVFGRDTGAGSSQQDWEFVF